MSKRQISAIGRGVQLGVATCFLAACTGCVRTSIDGDKIHFGMAWWAIGLMTLLSFVLMGVGYLAAKADNWRGYISAIAGAGLLLFGVPGMLMDYATLDDQHFEGRYGFWMAPTRYNVKFADVAVMNVVEKSRYSRRGKRYDYTLDLTYRDGHKQSVSIGDLLKEAAPELIARAEAANIQVILPPP
jgi:hypothetical protein